LTTLKIFAVYNASSDIKFLYIMSRIETGGGGGRGGRRAGDGCKLKPVRLCNVHVRK
jgi:hypothetical protein